jgi:DNA replication and repair protein RecF
MRLRRLTLQNLRNIPLAEFSFSGRQQFFVGQNGQGKTNLLEAVGFVTALRSFRTADTSLLIAQGKREGALAAEFDHEKFGPSRVVITLRSGGKEVTCDGERITRLGDFLGRFPTVVFSSQDQQLIRGAPALRRRWIDLALAATDRAYLDALTRFHRALDGRNQLLKRQAPAAELAAFEAPLAEAAAALVVARRAGVDTLAPHVAAAYSSISADAEPATLAYEADASPGEGDAAAWRTHFEKARPRDLQFRSSLSGPHRDDLALKVGGRVARDYGSEGQQRSLVLALRLAQVSHIRAATGIEPADDVLGELDPARRRRFWSALGEERQVLATGTELPDAELGTWEVFRVAAGAFASESSAGFQPASPPQSAGWKPALPSS